MLNAGRYLKRKDGAYPPPFTNNPINATADRLKIMLQPQSILKVADNSGAKKLRVIRVLGGYKKRFARVGDIVTCAVREAQPHTAIKKGDLVKAVIIRTRKEVRRKSGIYARFDDNAAVVIDPKTKEPKATRIFGPVARELRAKGFAKIISLAPEVL